MIPIFQVVGTIAGGILGDRVNKRALAAGAMLTAGCALFVLVFANSLWMIFVFALAHGFAWGVRGPSSSPSAPTTSGGATSARSWGSRSW